MGYKIKKIGQRIAKGQMEQLVRLHKVAFPQDARHDEDRRRIFRSWHNPPIMGHFGVYDKKKLIGYIRWVEHGGIRPKAVVELEQIATDPDYHGKGVATSLIDESLKHVSDALRKDGRQIKLVYVSTGNENFAQKLYQKTLGAKVVSQIPSFYEDSAKNVNEVIMLARLHEIEKAREGRRLKKLYD